MSDSSITRRHAVGIFIALGIGYFLSCLMRSVTGTLAPVLSAEFALSAGQLGLLSGAYFFAFAVMQLPLGRWLDHHGPRRVLLYFLSAAVISCLTFALAQNYTTLLLARLLCGVGVAACLVAPLTGFRAWFAPDVQLRTNAWMLMIGSFGMLASTLPVQWALPVIGWRMLFIVIALLFVLAMLATAWQVPKHVHDATLKQHASLRSAYAPIFANPYFRRLIPLGLINYGIQVAMQSLWAGPWMTRVAGYTPTEAAAGLFAINLTMLCVYWTWGAVTPRLQRAGFGAHRLMVWGLPLCILALALIAVTGSDAGWPYLAGFCALSSFLSLTQPALGMETPPQEAGRAYSAFNLLVFAGAFAWQWGIGLAIDALQAAGMSQALAFRCTLAMLALLCAISYASFALAGRRRAAGDAA